MASADLRPLHRRLIDLPLRIKLTFTFFVATLISVGLLILSANQVILEQNLDDEGHDLQLIANGLALTLGELLNAQLEKLAALASDDEVYLGVLASDPDSLINSFEPLVNELHYHQVNFGVPVEFIVTDRTGRPVAATDPALPDRLIDDPAWQALLAAARTSALIGAPYRFNVGWRFSVAYPVTDRTTGTASPTLGQIVALYQLDPLTTVLYRGREESMTQAQLLLSDGQTLNDAAQLALLPLSTRSTLSVTQEMQYSRFVFQGSDQLVSQSMVTTARGPQPAIEQLGWRVILHRDYADALRASDSATNVTDPIAVLAALAAAVIAFIVATIITAPIRQLTRVTQAAAAGDLNQRVHWPQRDELGQLAGTYNAMADAIQRRERELAEERSLLAQRVSDRTLELSVANDRLAAANAELARANRLKDEFLANMSHELRTPLTAILGLTEALRELDQGPLTARQASSLRIVEDSGRHLLALINDILDRSKIEAGKAGLQIEPVSVDAICASSLQFIKTAAARKGITVTSDTRVPNATLNADARRLKQILVNLLSNAVKFTPAGGQIGLAVEGDPDAGQLRFTVWDTGIGIRPEDQARLFQPFVQIDSSLARHYEGTGLGLALIARLTRLHGGAVSLDSVPGQGSRFIISLPWEPYVEASPVEAPGSIAAADQSDPMLAAPPPIDPAAPIRPLILLADDDEDSVEVLTIYLTRHGYRLITAHDGRAAIDRAIADRPTVIIMDIRMPDLDGLTAIRELRAHPDLARVPIIALTALAMPGDRERCLAAGATAYVSKPINLRELVRIIDAHLTRS
jgi:signal transduction histidine kinase/CheY-like chemotaxis protein